MPTRLLVEVQLPDLMQRAHTVQEALARDPAEHLVRVSIRVRVRARVRARVRVRVRARVRVRVRARVRVRVRVRIRVRVRVRVRVRQSTESSSADTLAVETAHSPPGSLACARLGFELGLGI